MRSLKKINIPKSIQSKKLIFEESWSDKFDTFFIYFISLVLIGASILCFKEIQPSLNNDMEYFLLICSLIFSFYVIYCKFTEKQLKEIEFDISKNEAKARIIEYGKKHNYRMPRTSGNLIYLNEIADPYSLQNLEQTTVIFLKENAILYTVIKEGSRSNFPVLFSQYSIKMDLKKLLQEEKVETSKKRGYFSSFFHG